MNAVNRVWSAVEVYMRALSFLLALFCILSFAAPVASAATADAPADQSVFIRAAASLDHFFADMGLGLVVVGEILAGQGVQTAAVANTSGLTSTQVSAILSLLSSFGADSTTISKVSEVLGDTTPIPTTDSIAVTSPNGGEQWEIGQLNTITWAPYGYNPDVNPAKDVYVYLVDPTANNGNGGTVGRIMDTGKASLHTYFNINDYDTWAKPGQYYVRVYNKATGQEDSSNALFTLLPRAVDIKVNGSDGPVTLSDNQPITVTFAFGTKFSSCMLEGVRETINGGSGVEFGNKYPISSTFNGYAYAPTPDTSGAIYVVCTKSDGSTRGDSVQVNIGSSVASSIKIVSPNGGETISIVGLSLPVTWKSKGLKSVSLALYKNDQWYTWMTKDIVPSGKDTDTYVWSFGGLLKDGDVGKDIFKVYVTGQKIDGTGYADDKSDASFSFVQNTPTHGYTLEVSPRSGKAPLAVKATVTVPPAAANVREICGPINAGVITWGEGESSSLTRLGCSGNYTASATHAYTKAGTYTAKFYKTGNTPCVKTVCPTSMNVPLPVASVIITVTEGAVVAPTTPAPTCTLKANDTTVKKGASVTLTWSSKNATNSSTAGGDKTGKPAGSVVVKPTQDTIYTKHVYGKGGEGTCQVKINVSEDRGSDAAQKVVWNPFTSLSHTLSLMQVGAVVLSEEYDNLFGGGQ